MKPDLTVITSFEPNSDILDLIKEVVERSDEISMIAIATVNRDGESHWCFSNLQNTSTMLGAIERMKHRIIQKTDDE